MGDGRAEGLSATGDGRQAAVSLIPAIQYQLLYTCFQTSRALNKIRYSVLYIVPYRVHKAQPLVENARTRQHEPDTEITHDWTGKCTFASLKA